MLLRYLYTPTVKILPPPSELTFLLVLALFCCAVGISHYLKDRHLKDQKTETASRESWRLLALITGVGWFIVRDWTLACLVILPWATVIEITLSNCSHWLRRRRPTASSGKSSQEWRDGKDEDGSRAASCWDDVDERQKLVSVENEEAGV
jgi:hypothetical protein